MQMRHIVPRGNVKLHRVSPPTKSRTIYSSACCRKVDKHSVDLAHATHAEVAIVAIVARRSAVSAGGFCGLPGRPKLPKATRATLQQTTVQSPQVPQDQDLELKEGKIILLL